MSDDDMRLDTKCDSSSSIASTNFMPNSDVLSNGKYQPHSSSRSLLHNSAARKEKTASIFSFLQRFRTKNKNFFEDVTSLPSSPRPIRAIRGVHSRWESVESVLSSATATSFAFIPPSQLRSAPKAPQLSTLKPKKSHLGISPDIDSIPASDRALFLRRKYNLLGSDASLYPQQECLNAKRALKKLHRNSVGNVENLKWERWQEQELFSSFRRPAKTIELVHRPKSEYDISGEVSQTRRVYCHKPGKGRAPQPPVKIAFTPTVQLKPGPRKKRKAPSPPKNHRMEKNTETEMVEKVEETKSDKPEEGAMYNDSLKLEKGQLKPNKSSSVISSSSVVTELSAPVSPKPWYKRSATRRHKKSNMKSLDKKKTCEQLLDEWMLEAGLPRSSSFYSARKLNLSSEVEQNGKRRSQISMLANISELDREAAEIVQKERKKERDAVTSLDDRFYEQSSLSDRKNSWNTFQSSGETTVSKRSTSKDLISILNAITNVTKITVNSSIFKENVGRSSISRQSSTASTNPQRKIISPETSKKQSSKLTITELEDFDEEIKLMKTNEDSVKKESAAKVILPPDVEPKPTERISNEPMKPVKPFSSWMCPQCTLENPSWKFICEACNKWRPYSVTKVSGGAAPLIRPKEDIKLHFDNFNCVTLADEHAEINKISQNIRKQVYDILSSGETVRKNLSKLKMNDDYYRKDTVTNTVEGKPFKFDAPQNSSGVERIDQSIEEIRKARLMFFSKNCLNDLNLKIPESSKKSPPMNVKGKVENNKYYNEEDRKKLREILKELKDSLPKNSPLEVNRLDKCYQKCTDLGNSNMQKEVNEEIEDIKEKVENVILSAGTTSINFRDDGKTSNEMKEGMGDTKKKLKNTSLNIEAIDENVSLEEMNRQVTEVVPSSSMTGTGNTIQLDTKTDAEVENFSNATKKYVKDLKNLEQLNKRFVNETAKTAGTSPKIFKNRDLRDVVNENVESHGEDEALSKQQNSDQKSLSDYKSEKNNIVNPKESKSLNSLAVNRLLKKLQTAIASGQHHEAANIARDLARLKVNCNVTRQETPDIALMPEQQPTVTVNLNIHRGAAKQTTAVSLKLNPAVSLNDLRMKMFKEYHIPLSNQQWMIGGKPITDSDATLEKIGMGVPEMNLLLSSISEIRDTSLTIEDKFVEKQPQTSTPGFILENQGVTQNTEKANIETNHSVLQSNAVLVTDSENNTEINLRNKRYNRTVFENKETKSIPEIHLTELKLETNVPNNSEWKCSRCTLINTAKEKICAACDENFDVNAEGRFFSNKPGPSHRNNEHTEHKLASYQELISMDMADVIMNTENFECSVCLSEYLPGEGVILKDCLHTFCKECLIQTVQHSTEAEVKCPFRDENYSCESALQEREIKALVSAEVYEQHLARSVAEAENKIQNTFHCKTVNCQGWCIFEDNVNEFHCPVCDKTNCLTCQVIHTGLNCKQYQEVINKDAETNADANRTKTMLLEMLQKGEAMTCPTCQIIVMKKWGCDWLRCSMCKTEICWVTRGPRWGPKGKGDTSAGCRCGVKGVKCHPRCTYCH